MSRTLLLIACLMFLGCGKTEVTTPNVNVKVGPGGVKVDAPGVKVDAGPGGAKVNVDQK
jgi:hypothetical protein